MAFAVVAVLITFAASFCDAALQAFRADLSALASSGVDGVVGIIVTSTGLHGMYSVGGLETNLNASASSCTATNGCGVHVHSGTSCDDSASQGGHFYAGATDPWSSIGYSSTNNQGKAESTFDVTTSDTNISGKPFIVHNNAGDRVACGILSELTTEASLTELSSSGVSGSVAVSINTTSGLLLGAGIASGLEASLSAEENCTATNGCGVHVHSGTSCEDSTKQGGHYFAEGETDPWLTIRYQSTSATGDVNFFFSVSLPSSHREVEGKAFIVHNNAGSRVACGILTAKPGDNDPGTAQVSAAACTAISFGLLGSVLLILMQ